MLKDVGDLFRFILKAILFKVNVNETKNLLFNAWNNDSVQCLSVNNKTRDCKSSPVKVFTLQSSIIFIFQTKWTYKPLA